MRVYIIGLWLNQRAYPSSSFEFVPVLLRTKDIVLVNLKRKAIPNILKYGEMLKVKAEDLLLTNYRALVYDVENDVLDKSMLKFFNTSEDCKIIKQHFKVFHFKVDLPTRSQMVRHRVSWQELSRRYVSGERVPFEFYISKKMENVESFYHWTDDETSVYSTDEVINICLNHYKQALEQGIKPQEARRIIPQAAYTQIWGAFMPEQLDNYFKLRLDGSSQWEIRQTAIAMQELINDKVGIETYV